MTTPPSPPATKEDIAMLMEQMGKFYDNMMHQAAIWKDEMRLHFDFTVETIRNELRGARRDEITGIKTRLTRVERKVGLA